MDHTVHIYGKQGTVSFAQCKLHSILSQNSIEFQLLRDLIFSTLDEWQISLASVSFEVELV